MTVRRVKPIDPMVGEEGAEAEREVLEEWEDLASAWPRRCTSKAEQKARRGWRKRAVNLLVARGGAPTRMRPVLWALVLEAAAESEPLNEADEVMLEPPDRRSGPEKEAEELKLDPDDDDDDDVGGDVGGGGIGDLEQELSPEARANLRRNTSTDEARAGIQSTSRGTRSEGGSLSHALSSPAGGGARGASLQHTTRQESEHDVKEVPRQIARDVPRTTVPRTVLDASSPGRSKLDQTRLQWLLSEFARTASPALRYCQGMNFLGATVLRVLDKSRRRADGDDDAASSDTEEGKTADSDDDGPVASFDEAATVVAFRGVMALVKPLYVPDFRGLREMVAVAGALLPRYAPKVAALLEAEGLDLMPITSAWCLTLFASTSMNDDLVLTCWDFLLLGTPTLSELVLDSIFTPPQEYCHPGDATTTTPPPPSTQQHQHQQQQQQQVQFSGGEIINGVDDDDDDDDDLAGPSSQSLPSTKTPVKLRRKSVGGTGSAVESPPHCLASPSQSASDSALLKRRQSDPALLTSPLSADLPRPLDPADEVRKKSWRRRLRSVAKRTRRADLIATVERHAILLRLCLTFLRLADGCMGDFPDLETLTEILGDTQDARRLGTPSASSPRDDDDEEPPGGEKDSCFPATAAELCAELHSTRIDNHTLHTMVKRHREDEVTRKQRNMDAKAANANGNRTTTHHPASSPAAAATTTTGKKKSSARHRFFASLASHRPRKMITSPLAYFHPPKHPPKAAEKNGQAPSSSSSSSSSEARTAAAGPTLAGPDLALATL